MKGHRKLGITVGVLLLIVISLLFIRHIFDGSASGTISVKAPITAKAVPERLIPVTGTYANYKYPSFFSPVKADPLVGPELADYNFIKQQLGSWQVAIQVTTAPTGSLTDLGSYTLRKSRPQQYSFSSMTITTQTVPIVTDVSYGAFNEIGYLIHGNTAATISLEGGNGQDNPQMIAALRELLSSWQWH